MDASHGLPVEGAVLRPSLKQLYRSALAAPSGIKQHLGILLRLARRSDHVTEFGTLGGVSTSILLAAQPKLLISYDLEKHPLIVALEYAARELRGTRFVFQQQDALEVEIGETDMLLIDAWHTYDLLRRGLALHSSKVRKYLALLHATTPGEVGEAGNTSPPRQAIEEFLPQNPEWSLSVLGAHNNGLTILTRSRGTCPTRRSSRW
jgi:predicted O-methyltransferase YrrM